MSKTVELNADAVDIKAEFGISYASALRLMERALAADPSLREDFGALLDRIEEMLEAEPNG